MSCDIKDSSSLISIGNAIYSLCFSYSSDIIPLLLLSLSDNSFESYPIADIVVGMTVFVIFE
jgi:hypothetical protein